MEPGKRFGAGQYVRDSNLENVISFPDALSFRNVDGCASDSSVTAACVIRFTSIRDFRRATPFFLILQFHFYTFNFL